MSDGAVKFKLGQKVVCSDDEIPTVIGTVVGVYGYGNEKVDWVGVKVLESFLVVGDFWHDASHIRLVDENGKSLGYQSDRNDCRFYRVGNVKVLGEV